MIRTLVVKGTVRGTPRPRVTTRAGHGHAYYPQWYYDKLVEVARAWWAQVGECVEEGPVSLTVEVHRKLPRSAPKSVRAVPDTVKPDVDNIVKLVMDALTGAAWMDDKQVTVIKARKFPRERIPEEFLKITVQEVPE